MNSTLVKFLKIALGLSVTIAAVVIILMRFDLAESTDVLKNYQLAPLFYGLVMFLLSIYIRGYRWHLLLRRLGSDVKLTSSINVFVGSLALNNLLPLRAGDIARAGFFRKTLNLSSAHSSASVVFERILDVLCVVGFFAVFSFDLNLPKAWQSGVLNVSVAVILACFFVILLPRHCADLIDLIIKKIAPFCPKKPTEKPKGKPTEQPSIKPTLIGRFFSVLSAWLDFLSRLLRGLKTFTHWRFLLIQLGIAIFGWAIEFQFYAFVLSGIPAQGYLPIAGIQTGTLTTLASMIPSSPGAFGNYHLGMVEGLRISTAALDANSAVALSIIAHLVTWGSVTLIGGLSFAMLAKNKITTLAVTLLACLALSSQAQAQANAQANTQASHQFNLEKYAGPLNYPWSITWMKDGRALVSERSGGIRVISRGGKVGQAIKGTPSVRSISQGGMLDIRLHPRINDRLYFCYSKSVGISSATAVGYGTLKSTSNNLTMVGARDIFVSNTTSLRGLHFGCRIRFDNSGNLIMATGERGEGSNSQDGQEYSGAIIRMTDEGKVPRDNPSINGWLPLLYAKGVRNPQGLIIREHDGAIIETEHGPQGGDELNLIKKGRNYGWPIISYGEEYGGGKIGEGTKKSGLQQPLYYWTPSIAPSGLLEYTGTAFPKWRNNLFVGALKFQLLARLEMQGNKVVGEERLLEKQIGRIRDVAQGPDGYIYLLQDDRNGWVWRLTPK